MPTRPQAAKRAHKPVHAPVRKKATGKVAVLHAKRNAKPGPFIAWYQMNFADKIDIIRAGIPARRVGELSSAMNISKEALIDSLGLSRATINRKVLREQPLSPEESERVMGMQALIGQVQAMVDEESAPGFNAAQWLASWLSSPLPALGGATPASFLDTVEGQKYIGNLLDMTRSGTYA